MNRRGLRMRAPARRGPAIEQRNPSVLQGVEIIATRIMELRERRTKRVRVGSPADAFLALRPFARKRTEHFLVLTLSAALEVIGIRIVAIGILNSSPVHPREVFWWAIQDNAQAVIVAHNHPFGVCEPSAEDRDMTVRLRQAGRLMGIEVLDHIIFSPRGYFSFQEHAAGSAGA
jgi:DNA repair protein RadC